MKKILVKNGIIATIGKMLAILVSFLLLSLLTRLFSVGEMSDFFLLVSAVNIATVISVFGMDRVVIRIISSSMENGVCEAGVIQSAIKIILCAVVLTSMFLVGVLSFGEIFDDNIWILFSVLFLFVVVSQKIIAEIFRAKNDILWATLIERLLSNIVVLGVVFLFFLMTMNMKLEDVLIMYFLSGLMFSLAGALLYRRLYYRREGRVVSCKELLPESLTIWLIYLIGIIFTQGDIWLFSIFSSSDEVAFYGAASKLAILLVTPAVIIDSVIVPTISRLYAKNELSTLSELSKKSTILASLAAIFLFFLYVMFGDALLVLVFGAVYKEAWIYLLILSFTQVVIVITGPTASIMMMCGMQKTLLFLSALSLTSMILGILIIGEKFGGTGVVFCVSTGIIFINITSLVLIKMRLGYWVAPGVRDFCFLASKSGIVKLWSLYR